MPDRSLATVGEEGRTGGGRAGGTVGQRVRVGAIGLACVFLLVMLATTFLRAAGDRSLDNLASPAANMAEPSEPLAELGVAPGNGPPGPAPARSIRAARSGAPAHH